MSEYQVKGVRYHNARAGSLGYAGSPLLAAAAQRGATYGGLQLLAARCGGPTPR